MNENNHDEMVWYFNEWLFVWNNRFLNNHFMPTGYEPNFEQAQLVNDTLSDLLIIDAEESGI